MEPIWGGKEEGLAILKHLKRINPGLYILAYTSKALKSDQSDFFILTNGALSKDAGVQESLEKIELALQETKSVAYLWKNLLALMKVDEDSPDAKKLEKALIDSIQKNNTEKIVNEVKAKVGDALSNTLIKDSLVKILEIGIKVNLGLYEI